MLSVVDRHHQLASDGARFLGRPTCAFVDPAAKELDLRVGQRGTFGRHSLGIILRRNATNKFALIGVAGDDPHKTRIPFLKSTTCRVEP
jgi:hypothetical protein